ncbi:MAG: ABC transporter substrate-binding protein, partial [Candidatus Peribacteraceae bacterium]|nr:ABC transporter substrate-binding protein [Candidatus Peribacteraceae bacterium]
MRRAILSIFAASRRFQAWIIAGCVLAIIGSLAGLLYRFWLDSTVLVPARGGTYIEGSVGEMLPWNPWFTLQNDVNRDIVSLVFSGLMQYDPSTKEVVDDLGSMSVSADGKVYTVTLHAGLEWHDSTADAPHPVTADDVLFTFQTIQDPSFPNPPLRENFAGVEIEKKDESTVTFTLDEPYAYFPTNLTFGLLPKRSFEGIPVARLEQTESDFGLRPVGAGPYRLKSFIQTELSSEVTLEKFARPLPEQYRLGRVVFRVFPDYISLLSDLGNLDAIRIVPQSDDGRPVIPNNFQDRTYTLPQYVALFFNLDHKITSDQKLRLGLQLGTDKQAIADVVGNGVVVDSPLLEIDTSDWQYRFDPAAAQGALYESQWYFPEKIRLQTLLEKREANRAGMLDVPSVMLITTGSTLAVNGRYSATGPDPRVNGVRAVAGTESGTWIASLPTVRGATGALLPGDNLVRVTNADGRILDSASVYRAADDAMFQRAQAEQDLVESFIASRDESLPIDQRVSAADLALDNGFLRKRASSDQIGIRANADGRTLKLILLTSPSPAAYRTVAEQVAKQWRELGVDVAVEIPENRAEFEARLLRREYDVLLYGQSLLNNLDAYPYWHSS